MSTNKGADSYYYRRYHRSESEEKSSHRPHQRWSDSSCSSTIIKSHDPPDDRPAKLQISISSRYERKSRRDRSHRRSHRYSHRRSQRDSHRRSHRLSRTSSESSLSDDRTLLKPKSTNDRSPSRKSRSKTRGRRSRRRYRSQSRRRYRRSESSFGGCITCNRNRSTKSTQTDSVYPLNPADQCTGTSNILPNLTDYAYPDFLEHSILNPLVEDRRSDCGGADRNNQNVTKTSVQQIQPADGNGDIADGATDSNTEENRPDGADQKLSMVCHVELTRLDMEHLPKAPEVKNVNLKWHSLSEKMDCKICGMCFSSHSTLVKHYVIYHPTAEVFPSRVAPSVAEYLRSSTAVHQCVKKKSGRYKYCQVCYFCNQVKTCPKYDWARHLASHTGCFKFPCVSERTPALEWVNLTACICDLCNYVRFNGSDMENHLKNEHGHGRDATDSFKEIIFLRFMRHPGDNWQNDGQLYLNAQDNRIRTPSTTHSTAERVIGRLAPSVAQSLRSGKYSPKCKVVYGSDRRLYEQLCNFCDETKCFSKGRWIEHMESHMGLIRGQCNSSQCKTKRIKRSHGFEGDDLTGYICHVCNVARFDRKEIEKHLRTEHYGSSEGDDFKEIIFLTFPDHGKRRRFVAPDTSESAENLFK